MIIAALGPVLFPFWAWLADASGWAVAADVAAVASIPLAATALIYVAKQIKQATELASVQASIQFQTKFKESWDSRRDVARHFPLHTSLGAAGVFGREWTDLGDLSEDERRAAQAVVGAFNDVAQYVTDGLPLQSALSQYHTIFIRLGYLLIPFLEASNAPDASGRPARYGRRVPILYNAAIAYHKLHPLHAGRVVALVRDGQRIVLLDEGMARATQFSGFPDDVSFTIPEGSVREAVAATERLLRRKTD